MSQSTECCVGAPKPKLNIAAAKAVSSPGSSSTLPVSDRIKLWQKSTMKAALVSPSPSSLDSENTSRYERLADFDDDSSTEEEQAVSVASSPSVRIILI